MGLFYFGLANAGVVWWGVQAWDRNSWAVFLGLGIGKTIGMAAFTLIGYLLMKWTPQGAVLPDDEMSGAQNSPKGAKPHSTSPAKLRDCFKNRLVSLAWRRSRS